MDAPPDKLPPDGLPGLCRHLRTKRYYYGSPDETLETAELSTTAQFWCLRTQRAVGPDERLVSAVACRAGRDVTPPGGRDAERLWSDQGLQ